MRKHQQEGETDEQLVQKCEKEWFNFGHNKRKIQARVTFLNNYMAEWREQIVRHRYDQKHKPLVYRPAQTDEIKVITDTILKHRKQSDRFNTIISNCMSQWEEELKQARIDAGPTRC